MWGGGEGSSPALLMVKIPRAKWGDRRTNVLSKGQGLIERERRLEDRNKEQISKNQSNI